MRVLVTGGGTGGHIYPALAIAKGVKAQYPEAEILFVGTARGMEAEIIPREGFAYRSVTVQGLPRKRASLRSLTAVFKTTKGSLEAYKILREFKPTVVVGTGGYVCGPVVMVAAFLKIPTLIHEQNVFPGFTNRVLARIVNKTAVTFPESKGYFTPKADIVITGLPIRPEILDARREDGISSLSLDRDKFTVLVTGGSQGASTLNKAMVEVIDRACGLSDIQIVYTTGQAGYDETLRELAARGIDLVNCGNITVKPYLYNMAEALSASDLVICRAGATTIAEITARGLPSILIPYPYAAGNHQEFNAQSLVKNGAAVMILDRDLSGENLTKTVRSLLDNRPRLAAMADRAKQLGKPEAAKRLLEIIEELNGK